MRREGRLPHVFSGSKYTVDFVLRIKLEIVVADGAVDRVVNVIQETAKNGKISDGKIFVWDIDKAMRIRMAKVNEAAV